MLFSTAVAAVLLALSGHGAKALVPAVRADTPTPWFAPTMDKEDGIFKVTVCRHAYGVDCVILAGIAWPMKCCKCEPFDKMY